MSLHLSGRRIPGGMHLRRRDVLSGVESPNETRVFAMRQAINLPVSPQVLTRQALHLPEPPGGWIEPGGPLIRKPVGGYSLPDIRSRGKDGIASLRTTVI